jgi:hypothetical protein
MKEVRSAFTHSPIHAARHLKSEGDKAVSNDEALEWTGPCQETKQGQAYFVGTDRPSQAQAQANCTGHAGSEDILATSFVKTFSSRTLVNFCKHQLSTHAASSSITSAVARFIQVAWSGEIRRM